MLLFEIPPAPRGMPIAWNGHFYGRAGESLVALGLDKLDLIRVQESAFDWSAQTVADAALDDIDLEAMRFARQAFAERHAPRISTEEVESWSDEGFLRHLGLLNAGGLTRTALLRSDRRATVKQSREHTVTYVYAWASSQRVRWQKFHLAPR